MKHAGEDHMLRRNDQFSNLNETEIQITVVEKQQITLSVHRQCQC